MKQTDHRDSRPTTGTDLMVKKISVEIKTISRASLRTRISVFIGYKLSLYIKGHNMQHSGHMGQIFAN